MRFFNFHLILEVFGQMVAFFIKVKICIKLTTPKVLGTATGRRALGDALGGCAQTARKYIHKFSFKKQAFNFPEIFSTSGSVTVATPLSLPLTRHLLNLFSVLHLRIAPVSTGFSSAVHNRRTHSTALLPPPPPPPPPLLLM
jgi:hypothetical protein